MVKRYHVALYFPAGAQEALSAFVQRVNGLNWNFTCHSFERIKEKAQDVEKVGLFLKGLELTKESAFEYYEENGRIIKAVFRLPYNSEKALILVVSDTKNIVTVYLNNIKDNHKTLDPKKYFLPALDNGNS